MIWKRSYLYKKTYIIYIHICFLLLYECKKRMWLNMYIYVEYVVYSSIHLSAFRGSQKKRQKHKTTFIIDSSEIKFARLTHNLGPRSDVEHWPQSPNVRFRFSSLGQKYRHIGAMVKVVAILGMVIPPLIGILIMGINPYYWVDDHPLLYGNNGSLDPGTYTKANNKAHKTRRPWNDTRTTGWKVLQRIEIALHTPPQGRMMGWNVNEMSNVQNREWHSMKSWLETWRDPHFLAYEQNKLSNWVVFHPL